MMVTEVDRPGLGLTRDAFNAALNAPSLVKIALPALYATPGTCL